MRSRKCHKVGFVRRDSLVSAVAFDRTGRSINAINYPRGTRWPLSVGEKARASRLLCGWK